MGEAPDDAPKTGSPALTPILTLSETRRLVGVVLPVYFKPEVPEPTIRGLLDRVLVDSEAFCRPENLLAVVDRGTLAEQVLRTYPGLRIQILPRNRAKAGAIAAGLRELLVGSDAEILITRDGDADHNPEDIPRLASRLLEIRKAVGDRPAAVMGARISLEKPMGWVREQWELLTNRILVEMTAYRLAQLGTVLDRRYWAGLPPDIQSGYRAYCRRAAELTVRCLDEVPEQRDILTFSCEFVPFTEILVADGCFGQVLRSTLVEQPVTSYGSVDYAVTYGRLLRFMADRYGVPARILARIAENYLGEISLLYCDQRSELGRFAVEVGVNPSRFRNAGFV